MPCGPGSVLGVIDTVSELDPSSSGSDGIEENLGDKQVSQQIDERNECYEQNELIGKNMVGLGTF